MDLTYFIFYISQGNNIADYQTMGSSASNTHNYSCYEWSEWHETVLSAHTKPYSETLLECDEVRLQSMLPEGPKISHWRMMFLCSDCLKFIVISTLLLPPLSLQTQTCSSSTVGVSCSLSLSRCLQKVGWSISVYEENPAPFCSRNWAISSLPVTQDTTHSQTNASWVQYYSKISQRWPIQKLNLSFVLTISQTDTKSLE